MSDIPAYQHFIEPLLRVLAEHPDGIRAQDAYEIVADRLGLDLADRQLLLPSGAQAVYKNRIGWAHDRLKRESMSRSSRRGVWVITQRGLDFHHRHSSPFDSYTLASLASVDKASRLRDLHSPPSPDEPALEDTEAAAQTPDERIEAALTELRASLAEELLASLLANSPSFFERAVLDLLHAMGYGTSRTDLQQVGRAGDGGIDGIISLDRLGLEKVYCQAKRWQSNVGRPQVQGFYGALAGQRATKGVFISTSEFTREAIQYAADVSGGLVLIGGQRLAGLMIEHGVGVSHRRLLLPKIDSDYFES